MNNETKFFGEWVYWDDDKELQDAYVYLALWKKFIVKRLPDMEQVGNDQFVLRPIDENQERATVGIKIEMKGKLTKNILILDKSNDLISNYII